MLAPPASPGAFAKGSEFFAPPPPTAVGGTKRGDSLHFAVAVPRP